MTQRISPRLWSDAAGFTLIETVIVLILLGIAAAVLTALQGGVGSILGQGHSVQTRAMLQQQCAENVLARRRLNGIADAVVFASTASNCSFAGQSVTMTVNSGYSGAGCPAGVSCTRFIFDGVGLPNVVLVLPDYEL